MKICNSQIKLKGKDVYFRCQNQPGHPGKHWAPTWAIQGSPAAEIDIAIHWEDDDKRLRK